MTAGYLINMKNHFHSCLLAILCIAGSHGWAQSFIGDAKQPINSAAILSSSASSFVPVEQAFQLAVAVEADQIVFNWSIRDGYYLYRDRFKFNAVDATSQLRSPVFETGKIKNVDELYTGKVVIENVSPEVIDQMYKMGFCEFSVLEIEKPIPNQYFVLKSGSMIV